MALYHIGFAVLIRPPVAAIRIACAFVGFVGIEVREVNCAILRAKRRLNALTVNVG